MKIEDADVLSLVPNENYRFIFSKEKFGVQPNVPAIFFPSTLDRWLNEKSDSEGIFWILKQGKEELYVAVLKEIMNFEAYNSPFKTRLLFTNY